MSFIWTKQIESEVDFAKEDIEEAMANTITKVEPINDDESEYSWRTAKVVLHFQGTSEKLIAMMTGPHADSSIALHDPVDMGLEV